MLSKKKIEKNLEKNKYNLILLNKTDSTNSYAKRLAQKDNKTVIIAKQQTNGRGRLGKSFISKKGGLYITCIVKPYNVDFNAGVITACAAKAVGDAIKEVCGIQCGIKWVNDLYIEGKKVCGILAETVQHDSETQNIILGIGINVNKFKPDDEIREIATSLKEHTNKAVNINLLAARVINNLYREQRLANNLEFLKDYRDRSIILSKEIVVIKNDQSFTATALRINDDCSLTVLKNGEEINLTFGEISIKTR